MPTHFIRLPISLFRKTVSGTILILLLFIFLIFIPCISITQYANRLITEKIRFGNENFLQSASSSLDNAIQAATNQVSVLIQTNSSDYYTLLNTSSMSSSDATLSSYHLYNALHGCNFDSTYFDDMFLYFRKPGLVLTSSGSYDAQTYFQKKYMFADYSSDYFETLMDMHFISRVCPSTSVHTQTINGEELMLYDSVIPIAIHPASSSSTDALLVLLINEVTLTETFNRLNPNRSCYLYLMDMLSNDVLNHPTDTDYISLLNLSDQEFSGRQGSITLKASSENYRLLWINSSIGKLRYICVEPKLLISKQLHSFLLFTFLITFTAVVLLVLLYYFITSKLKDGFASIFHRMNETSGFTQSFTPSKSIDLPTLKNAVDLLCRQFEYNHPHLILSFLSRLLQDITEEEEILEYCEHLDAFKPDDYFCILVLRINFPAKSVAFYDNFVEKSTILASLHQKLTEYGYVVPFHDRQDYILFLTAPSTQKIQNTLNHIIGDWEQITSQLPEFVCGQSDIFHDIHEAYRNYHQVLTLLDYYGIRILKPIYQITDIMTASDQRLLSEEKKKIQTLAKHSPESCSDYVKKILTDRKKQNISFCQYKTTILELLFLLQQILYEADIPFSAVFDDIDEDWFSNAENFLSPGHLETLCITSYGRLSCMIPNIHESLGQAKQTLLNYIDEHLADVNLTVLADITGMNQNYLSQYFKKHFGITFLDYVTGKKIERAKDLLINTSLTCKTIGESLGYHDPNVFIRTFKKSESITPNEYRKLHKEYF